MTLLWQVSLGLEVALLVVFALAVVTTLLSRDRTGGATVSAYRHRPAERRSVRDRQAA